MTSSLRILIVAAEMTPFVKTGGLADVIGALPKALVAAGHDVRVVIPRYGWIDVARFGLSVFAQQMLVPPNDESDVATIYMTTVHDVPVLFVDYPAFFDRDGVSMYDDDDHRFIFFCRAALESCRHADWSPDVIHCHDWHTAIIPNWLRTTLADDAFFVQTASLLTIHNLAFQGVFGHRVLEIAGVPALDFAINESADARNSVALLGRGIYYADMINTVSPSYANEILDPAAGAGLDAMLRSRYDRLHGVLNGIDGALYNPATDTTIANTYSLDDLTGKIQCKLALQRELGLAEQADTPLLSVISRLTNLKGYDLIDELIEPLLQQHAAQIVVMGTGQQRFHSRLNELRARYPHQIAFRLTFDEALAHRIIAGADLFLMPSRVEPCGTGQMIAMRYGTVPVVRATGGLRDTVLNYHAQSNYGTGFVFDDATSSALRDAIERALAVYTDAPQWRMLMMRGMLSDFTWQVAAQRYVDLYRRAIAARHHS
ncbi:MAG: glycogen synthase [Chloroflexota bacterium]|jgi:starch synthase